MTKLQISTAICHKLIRKFSHFSIEYTSVHSMLHCLEFKRKAFNLLPSLLLNNNKKDTIRIRLET